MITITTFINDQYLNSHWADGLIISSPRDLQGSQVVGAPL